MKPGWLRDLRAVLFDFDGTLVHLTIDFDLMRDGLYELATRHGAEVNARCRQLFVLEFIAHVAAKLSHASAEQAARFEAEAQALIREIELEAALQAELFPGVPELLWQMHEWGAKLAIVTRNCREATAPLIARHQLPVDVVLTRDDVPKVKPDPDHLHRALSALGVPGERSLMVGDHPMDIAVGRAVGARTAAVLRPGQTPDRYAESSPDLILDNISDLMPYFEERESE